MAQRFKGFNPEQTATLLRRMGYTGSSDAKTMDQFIAANPAAAAKLGKYTETASRMIAGKPAAQAVPMSSTIRAFAVGGAVKPDETSNVTAATSVANTGRSMADLVGEATAPSANTTANTTANTNVVTGSGTSSSPMDTGPTAKELAERKKKREEKRRQEAIKAGQQELVTNAFTDPTQVITPVEGGDVATQQNQFIKAGTGNVAQDADATAQGVTNVSTATTPATTAATTYDATKVTPAVTNALGGVEAARGTVSGNAQVTAQTQDPTTLAQLNVDAAQIAQAQTVQAPAARALQAGEAVQGSAVDMAKVADATNIVAAQAEPSKAATVQGQLEGLMTQFEGGKTPAWAAGAMRSATAALASRGLGASSMAGQAIIQATMESALPIAMADAQTRANFESQNLSNRQQAAMLGAEQRAKFLEMDFDQNFQSRVINAAKISDIANMNFTAEQQIALENARMAQTVDIENLGARNAKILADAAAMSQMDMANLSNRQQAAVQNANSFLQMDMANLSNEQQTAMFKAQSIVQSLFTDQAAENVAKQINAASQNQVTQFYAGLSSQTSQFNASQQNAMKQFNVSEVNAMTKFNEEQEQQVRLFNAENTIAIAQANAKWRQEIATTEFASQHEANMQNALSATSLSAEALGQIWQRENDLMDYAFRASESEKDRLASIAMAKLTHEQEAKYQSDVAKGQLVASLFSSDSPLWSIF